MIVAIWAFENTYGGLHGIENYRIVEVEDVKAAEEWAAGDSIDVMESYGDIISDFRVYAERKVWMMAQMNLKLILMNVSKIILAIRFGK